MSKAGRKPKPTHLKILAGNPGKRPINNSEPKPQLKRPKCPTHLKGEARKEWNRMSKVLFDLGLLTEVDRAALAAYCVAWGRFVQAENELQKPDARLVSMTDSGYQQPSAWLQVSERAVKQMRAFMTEFGMTPSSRSRVTVDKPKDGDPFMDFLQGE